MYWDYTNWRHYRSCQVSAPTCVTCCRGDIQRQTCAWFTITLFISSIIGWEEKARDKVLEASKGIRWEKMGLKATILEMGSKTWTLNNTPRMRIMSCEWGARNNYYSEIIWHNESGRVVQTGARCWGRRGKQAGGRTSDCHMERR